MEPEIKHNSAAHRGGSEHGASLPGVLVARLHQDTRMEGCGSCGDRVRTPIVLQGSSLYGGDTGVTPTITAVRLFQKNHQIPRSSSKTFQISSRHDLRTNPNINHLGVVSTQTLLFCFLICLEHSSPVPHQTGNESIWAMPSGGKGFLQEVLGNYEVPGKFCGLLHLCPRP